MNRFKIMQRLQVGNADPSIKGGVNEEKGEVEDTEVGLRPSGDDVTENKESCLEVEIRREASSIREFPGDYLDVPSNSYLMKILAKQGDKKVLFADKVLKFTGSGKTKRRVLLITDMAMYIVDPDFDALKRRISLDDIESLCLSELSDAFFAIIIPKEYDLLMASTRKTEIVTVLTEISLSAYQYELEVTYSNRFTYNAAAEFRKEVQFEEIEGGIKTRILNSLQEDDHTSL